MAFKAQKQQQQIKANLARDIERINKLANYKAQIVQTMSSNMSHIKENNSLLHKLDLWQRATVYQSTGFKLAQRVLKYSPEAILKWGEQRLSRSISTAKPHSALLPASINATAVSSASSVQTPIAIDFVSSHGVNQTALDIPKTSHFQGQYLGSYKEGTRDPNKIQQMQEARKIAQANPNRQIEQLRVVVLYSLNPSMNPHYQLRTTVTS